jgi:hypothetical protein
VISRLAARLPGILPLITAAIARARFAGQIATIWVATICACDKVEGGAVELSWKLRPSSSKIPDKFVACESGEPLTNPVTKMRLEWSVTTDDDQIVTGTDEWPCDDSHGVTGFDLPPGTALLSVKPICDRPPNEVEALPSSYIAPAAEQRRVNLGDTVSLGAVELVVVVSYCEDQSCICE